MFCRSFYPPPQILDTFLAKQNDQLTPFQLSCSMMSLSRQTSAAPSERARAATVLTPHVIAYFDDPAQTVDEIGLRNISIAIGRLKLCDPKLLESLSKRIVAAAAEMNFGAVRSLLQIISSSPTLESGVDQEAVAQLMARAEATIDQAPADDAIKLLSSANRCGLLTRSLAVAAIKQLLREIGDASWRELSMALTVCCWVELQQPRVLALLLDRLLELPGSGRARDWAGALYSCSRLGYDDASHVSQLSTRFIECLHGANALDVA